MVMDLDLMVMIPRWLQCGLAARTDRTTGFSAFGCFSGGSARTQRAGFSVCGYGFGDVRRRTFLGCLYRRDFLDSACYGVFLSVVCPILHEVKAVIVIPGILRPGS